MTELTSLIQSGQWNTVKTLLPAWGLLSVLRYLGPNIKGVEIGVHSGMSSYLMLSECLNIELLLGIDHYLEYRDWNGTVTQATQDQLYEIVKENASFMGPRFVIMRERSDIAAGMIKDDSLDFIYIDGDHSTEAAYQDLVNYVPKVKAGGIVAGHDIGLPSVQTAIDRWRSGPDHSGSELYRIDNNSWYWVKN